MPPRLNITHWSGAYLSVWAEKMAVPCSLCVDSLSCNMGICVVSFLKLLVSKHFFLELAYLQCCIQTDYFKTTQWGMRWWKVCCLAYQWDNEVQSKQSNWRNRSARLKLVRCQNLAQWCVIQGMVLFCKVAMTAAVLSLFLTMLR